MDAYRGNWFGSDQLITNACTGNVETKMCCDTKSEASIFVYIRIALYAMIQNLITNKETEAYWFKHIILTFTSTSSNSEMRQTRFGMSNTICQIYSVFVAVSNDAVPYVTELSLIDKSECKWLGIIFNDYIHHFTLPIYHLISIYIKNGIDNEQKGFVYFSEIYMLKDGFIKTPTSVIYHDIPLSRRMYIAHSAH